MSIAIHHGSPGSYKTSGAIQDNLIPAINQGRVCCTNVRGLDCEKTIRKNLKNVPESFRLIHIDTSTSEGRLKMATFFHWLPADAFLFIDEINTIYPTTDRPADLAKYDYVGGIDQATLDQRPANVVEAFEMHRHYNWDICCTTPHIRKVHAIVRGSAEGAFRHKNQALVGLKGMYQEILHSADDDGKNRANHLQMRQRRIKKNVFKLYRSTTTDKTRDTQAGRNIFLSPQVIGFAFLFFAAGIYIFNKGAPTAFSPTEADNMDVQIAVASNKNAINNDPVSAADPLASSHNNVNGKPEIQPIIEPDYLSKYEVYYVGNIKFNDINGYQLQLVSNNKSLTVQSDWLASLGYELTIIGECLAELSHPHITRLITCPLSSVAAPRAESPAKSFNARNTLPM